MDYKTQFKHLKEHPEDIYDEWQSAIGLFSFVEIGHQQQGYIDCGCLTMIRNGGCYAYVNGEKDLALTQEIQADERLPVSHWEIEAKHLPVFKEWWDRLTERHQTLISEEE